MCKEDCAGGYRWLNGYRSCLSERLDTQAGLLPLANARDLAVKLIDGHTYLVIDDGTGAEIVKASAFGNQVKIERGVGGTAAKAFPAGAVVRWDVTQMSVCETVCAKRREDDDCGCLEGVL